MQTTSGERALTRAELAAAGWDLFRNWKGPQGSRLRPWSEAIVRIPRRQRDGSHNCRSWHRDSLRQRVGAAVLWPPEIPALAISLRLPDHPGLAAVDQLFQITGALFLDRAVDVVGEIPARAIALRLPDHPGLAAVDQLFQITGPLPLDRAVDLIGEQVLVGGFFDVPEYSNRNRVLRVLHSGQHVCQVRVARLFIVDDQLGLRHAVVELHNFEMLIVDSYASIPVFSEDERLAVLELDHPVFFHIATDKHLKGRVVEDIAVLVDLDERHAFVSHRALDDRLQMFRVPVDRPGDEGGFGGNRNRQRIQRVIDHAKWSGFRLLPKLRRRRVLPLG